MEKNLFSIKLFNMSTDNIKELKSFLDKAMEENIQSVEEKLLETFPKETDHKSITIFLIQKP